MEALSLEKIFTVLGQYGLPLCLVVYFLYRDHVREQRTVKKEDAMVDRIQALEKEMRDLLMDLIEKTHAIIVANSEAMQDWLKVLQVRPCLADELSKKIMDETVKMVKDSIAETTREPHRGE